MEIADVQTPVTEYARETGWLVRRMQFIGTNGCPDSWFFQGGVTLIFEFKDEGEEPKLHQWKQINKLKKAGMKVFVIDNYEEGCAILDRYRPLD